MNCRPANANRFEFAVVAGLRAHQLTRGSVPRLASAHKATVLAQLEVAAGLIVRDVDTVHARID
jgi:DNA-directed RNA polymerase subunit K/omega